MAEAEDPSRGEGDAARDTGGREQDVTDRVIASFAEAPSPRFREVMASLVRHTHAFVREVRLTETEWEAAVDFLRRTGDMTDDKRHEFILLSDVLGVSMLTVAVNQPDHPRATDATVFGPFFVEGSPEVGQGGDIGRGASGRPCWVSGTVTDTEGRPLAGARVDVWEADDEGLYDVQRPDGQLRGRGHLFTDEAGGYGFWGITPTPYPIPHDGPVGDLLTAAGRSPMRAAHLHLMVAAPGHHRLVTHIFVRGGEHQETDAVFGVKESLVVDFVERPAGAPTPTGRVVDGPWTTATFDVVLVPDEAG
jgi:protocatechuate 3,4-dioxygenase beta subunit